MFKLRHALGDTQLQLGKTTISLRTAKLAVRELLVVLSRALFSCWGNGDRGTAIAWVPLLSTGLHDGQRKEGVADMDASCA